MLDFNSDYNADELSERWDEFTSPSRFAGSDEMLDLVFVSNRKDNKVKLVRRAKTNREPFSCVFRGKIEENGFGSKISGFFTKSIFDYAAIGAILALLYYIRCLILERGESPKTINILLIFAIVAGIALLYNTRASRRKYCEFISRITGKENKHFLSKKEMNEENDD